MDGLVGVMTTAFGEGAEPKALKGVQGSGVGRRWEARVRKGGPGVAGALCVLCALILGVKWESCPTRICSPSPSSHLFTPPVCSGWTAQNTEARLFPVVLSNQTRKQQKESLNSTNKLIGNFSEWKTFAHSFLLWLSLSSWNTEWALLITILSGRTTWAVRWSASTCCDSPDKKST